MSKKFGAVLPQDFKTAKEPGKTIGSNHVLGEIRKENFLIKEFMSRKNPFEKPLQEDKKEEKGPIQGESFTMSGKPYFSKDPGRVRVEFRPGASSEEATKDLEREDAERKSLQQEYREKEAKMTPEEKAQRAEEWARQDRNWMAEWFEDGIKKSGEYSEALQIKQDGSLDREKRVDGRLPFIVSVGDLKSPEDLYQLMYKISQENPELNISFEVDSSRKWIKYRVVREAEDKK